jgi:hypothetical protein
VIAWSEVLGYCDDSGASVRLVLPQDVGTYSAIPTPTEADRVAVLSFLDARGLKRVS